ncbi:protein PML-like isoform X2 [Stegostoma tigrinum]|uniref:protein PML-like isoform X2 n=1 Tax=Stegostoma tigrinum TaxID=3053191 RepID=UPI00286FF15D|nr:protein PML-like isoform X2 [Stegostoma tigrinum]
MLNEQPSDRTATAMATGSEVRIEEYFQCLLCNQPVTKPKLLKCLHTFCVDCLQQESSGTGIKCPICEMVTRGDPSSLQDNILVANLQNKVKKQHQIRDTAELSCAFCDASSSPEVRTSPEFMCLECDKFLCNKCFNIHQVLMVDHQKHVQTLGTLRKLDSDEFLKILTRPKHLFCNTHDDQQISLYCNTCSVWLCVLCLVLEHKDHNCCGIRKQIVTLKNDLREMLGSVQENETKFSKAQGDLEMIVDKLNSDKYKMEELINARVRAAIEKVKEEESRLLNELKELHSARVQKLQESLTRTENVLKRMTVSKSFVSQLLRYATEQEILELRGTVKSALLSLQKEQPVDVQMENTVINFKECLALPKKMLGNLILSKTKLNSVLDENLQLPQYNSPDRCGTKDLKQRFLKCCDKRKCDTEVETQTPMKQCVKEEANKSTEETVTTFSPNYSTCSPLPCIENVTSYAGNKEKQTELSILDTVVELIQIDSEDSN